MNNEQKQQIQVLGMVWYKRENYEQLKNYFEDGNKLHNTYDEWFNAAEIGRKRNESNGVKVVCVDIDPVEFPKWCKENNMKPNENARTQYVNLEVYKAVVGNYKK
jgi:hypothetical protein